MRQGLIGHSGFVGKTLAQSAHYDETYNSSSIELIRGRDFDRLVCAGVSAVKWKANLDPQADWAGIERLIAPLRDARAALFVLISTVDVYPDPRDVDEDSIIDPGANHAYGRHRFALERAVREIFPRVLVVRLPALFGPNLAKNVIFDLIHHNQVEKINGASAFQWYDLAWLDADLRRAEGLALELVNFAVEPIRTREIVERFFPESHVGHDPATAVCYDMHSRFADKLGGVGRYLKTPAQILSGLEAFIGPPAR